MCILCKTRSLYSSVTATLSVIIESYNTAFTLNATRQSPKRARKALSNDNGRVPVASRPAAVFIPTHLLLSIMQVENWNNSHLDCENDSLNIPSDYSQENNVFVPRCGSNHIPLSAHVFHGAITQPWTSVMTSEFKHNIPQLTELPVTAAPRAVTHELQSTPV